MATEQPKWKRIANLGDVNPVDYGGYFIEVDETGVYEAEAMWLVAPETDSGKWIAYRFILERCKVTDGVLSDNPYHPTYPVWFAKELEAVATSMGTTADKLRADFCSADPITRARAYQDIGEYFGWENFDHYPRELDRAEAEELAERR